MLPTFLIIGAPRSGTTFLFCCLASHPGIGVARKKEVHYFDDSYDNGLSWYEEFFAHCNGTQAVGEKTASYFYVPECAERIKRTLGEVKLIVVLRNPIERAYSQYRRWVAGRSVSLRTSFRDCLLARPEILLMGNYYDHLTRYLEHFSMEGILVLFSDDLFRDPLRQLGRAADFLGLGDHGGSGRLEDRNGAPKVYSIGGYVLPQRVARLLERPVLGGPAKPLRDLMEHRFGPISEEDKGFLGEYYGKQNEKLFGLLETRRDWISGAPVL